MEPNHDEINCYAINRLDLFELASQLGAKLNHHHSNFPIKVFDGAPRRQQQWVGQ
jgi:hypothetical protein